MELQATALQGIVKSLGSNEYLLPIQDLSALQELKGYLTTAIDVLSNLEEQSTEHRLDAIRTLNSFVAALSLHDGDHYEAMDSAFKDVRK